MRLSAVVASTLALAAHAAPAPSTSNARDISDSTNALGGLASFLTSSNFKAQTERTGLPPLGCDLSHARMQLNGLPPPSAGLTVRHVAVGRGTQNYTCDASNPTAVPQPIGAMATLYNVSCVAAMWPTLVEVMPLMAVALDLSTTKPAGVGFAPVSGVHYFTDLTTPYFDLDTPSMDIGEAPCVKNSSAAAPGSAFADMGQWKGSAVPWLKLTTKDGATGNIKEVYRVNTVGGSAPSSCKGQPANLEVQYSALYWFWESNGK